MKLNVYYPALGGWGLEVCLSDFAKLFNTEVTGQILVKIDSNEEGAPEIRYYFTLPNMGVCSMAISFTDSDSGWDSADKAFVNVDIKSAEKVV